MRLIHRMCWLMAPLCAGVSLAAQKGAPPRFSTRTSAVVVDVVVRDQQHQPVRALTADDFEVYEDGVRQAVTSFDAIDEPVRAPSAIPAGSSAGDAGTSPEPQLVPAVTALVFEQLGPEARRLSEEAARAFITDSLTDADYAGVFFVDRAIHVITPYTNDKKSLLDGVHRATSRPGFPLEFPGRVPGADTGIMTPTDRKPPKWRRCRLGGMRPSMRSSN